MALRKWFSWCGSRGIQPTLSSTSQAHAIQHISDFVLMGFREGYGSDHRVRSSTISATLSGIRHFFLAAGVAFPCGNPQIRMLLKGSGRLDKPTQRKAPITSFGKGKFTWFALKAEDVAILDRHGAPTLEARAVESVHIRLKESKPNQRGESIMRVLNRSGYRFVFGALCAMNARSTLPQNIPVSVFLNQRGVPECVSSARVSTTIQRVVARSGGISKEYSAHSLRAGGATQMYRAGVDTLTILFHGR
ncbi:hypothetical protein PHMEG_0007023 [Phytophthora megakarya]|uniref:Tyr recombinase domain-containing protein n=1 Tax=Phytophthora megakarya TaxID=4795 RepID=A0A225WMC7_9STRA|nr:hypothetical protein PHMEG_0007023 [Phytophthora megakarya]